jgi:hypothetical protein
MTTTAAIALTPQQKICAILQWKEEQHSQMVYDNGLSFLVHYLPMESEFMINCITSSRIFWNWWRLHWNARDEQFASLYFNLVRLKDAEDLYKELHNPKTLAYSIYPDGVVLEETYAKMIGELNDSELCNT